MKTVLVYINAAGTVRQLATTKSNDERSALGAITTPCCLNAATQMRAGRSLESLIGKEPAPQVDRGVRGGSPLRQTRNAFARTSWSINYLKRDGG
jgi:hypothetical protein